MSRRHPSAFLLHLAKAKMSSRQPAGAGGVEITEGGSGPARPSQKTPESNWGYRGQRPACGMTGDACRSQENLWGQGLFWGSQASFTDVRPVASREKDPCSVRCSAAMALKCVIILNTDPAFSFLSGPHVLCSGCWVLRWAGMLSR